MLNLMAELEGLWMNKTLHKKKAKFKGTAHLPLGFAQLNGTIDR